MPVQIEYNNTNLVFSKLTNEDSFKEFVCEDEDDADFIKNDVSKYNELNLGVTYVLKNLDKKVIGFITLATGAIDLNHLKLEFPVSEKPRKVPALLIGRIATTKEEQRKGYGSKMLEIAAAIALEIKEKIGCRLLLVHSKTEERIIEFYKKNGFKTCFQDFVGKDTVPMYLDLFEGK